MNPLVKLELRRQNINDRLRTTRFARDLLAKLSLENSYPCFSHQEWCKEALRETIIDHLEDAGIAEGALTESQQAALLTAATPLLQRSQEESNEITDVQRFESFDSVAATAYLAALRSAK